MVAVAIGGAAVIGGATSVIAGNKAAKAQKNAAAQQAQISREQIAEERRQYDLARSDYAPYRETGYKALDTLSSMYGVNKDGKKLDMSAAVAATPGYQFRMDEGQKAIERSQAARGLLTSGATGKALTRYAQNYASGEYENFANRLASLAGVGQSATNSTTAAGQAMMSGIGNANQMASNAAANAGNARASSYANAGSAINTAINNGLSAYLYSQGGGFSAPNSGLGGIY